MRHKSKLKPGFNINTKYIMLDDITVNFLKNMRSTRKKLGYTQLELANRIGCNRILVLAVEKGYSLPTLAILIKLAKILKTDISESINYKFFYRKIKTEQILEDMRTYGLSFVEISRMTGYSARYLSRSANMKPDASIHCLEAVLQVIHKEKAAAEFRDKLTREKRRAGRPAKFSAYREGDINA